MAANALPQGPILREKRETTLRARCALAGIVLYRTQDDHGRVAWLLTRGPMTRELPSLDAVEEFLDEAGAR